MKSWVLVCAAMIIGCAKAHPRRAAFYEGPAIGVMVGLPTAVVIRGTIKEVGDDFVVVRLQRADCFGTGTDPSPCAIPQERKLDVSITYALAEHQHVPGRKNPKALVRGQPVWTDAATSNESDPIGHILELIIEQRDFSTFFLGTPGPVVVPER